MSTEDRDWLVKGARVAALTISSGKPASFQVRTVARFTETQVILDDDGRWRLKDLRPVGDSNRSEWATYRHELAPLDDPLVVTVRVAARLRNLGRVVEPWLGGGRVYTDVAGGLELLDQVAQAVAETRARVAALEPSGGGAGRA
ncbi:hypothetical protein [Micromonospora sp. WMMD737]|uniref:hypothetical protein n=1 Tax=Micromonospora sp. WMMD737 TaxID=3404113 RepID=UPI003B9616A3